MTEHTQGPFVAFVKHDVICVHLEKDDSPHLTEVISWQGFDSCDIESHDERVANAYLFAAAPEMYDALVLEHEAAGAMSDFMFATTIPSNDDEVGRLRQEWIIAANKASKAREAVLTKASGEVT